MTISSSWLSIFNYNMDFFQSPRSTNQTPLEEIAGIPFPKVGSTRTFGTTDDAESGNLQNLLD